MGWQKMWTGPATSIDGPSRRRAAVGDTVARSAFLPVLLPRPVLQRTLSSLSESLSCHIFFQVKVLIFISIMITSFSDDDLYADTENHKTSFYPSRHHTSCHTSHTSNLPLAEVVSQVVEVQVN